MTMLDEIHIRDLQLRAIIGLSEEERRDRQDIRIDLVLYTDTRPAASADSIDQAVNYRTLTKRVIEVVEGSRFFLVETLASEIASVCLQFSGVERVQVSVEKPGALRFARSVGVLIERARQDA
jgi:dihydroneopterin aldolase/D-erythro-7,8-dihydroneopterin triphosphate epimerase